jgi:hypothetical protein
MSVADGISLTGTVLYVTEGRPWQTNYAIQVDRQWHTRQVAVEMLSRNQTIPLHLTADGAGHWFQDGTPLVDLDGCLDIDLGMTPSTNTLPIRRLALAPGQGADLVAAWVQFPSLAITPLPQRYECMAPDRVQYRSDSFAATLAIDVDGVVLDYEHFWQMIAQEA